MEALLRSQPPSNTSTAQVNGLAKLEYTPENRALTTYKKPQVLEPRHTVGFSVSSFRRKTGCERSHHPHPDDGADLRADPRRRSYAG